MTEPASDFERWIASSPVPPDKRDPDSLCEGIAAAIRSRDFGAVNALMTMLAFADPDKARSVLDVITAVTDGDERRAVLLAVLGG
jgi:hypothetical protein